MSSLLGGGGGRGGVNNDSEFISRWIRWLARPGERDNGPIFILSVTGKNG